MSITDWPKEDRPREKLLHRGEKLLTDAELIAIFLKNGTKGQTALDMAKALLMEFGSLKKLLASPSHLLMQRRGVGPAKYATLLAGLELGRRYLSEPIVKGEILSNSSKATLFLANHLKEYPNEVFACLFMDNRFRIICFQELFHGTINQANIYPREIIRRGLMLNAAKIILAHNHPSGIATPSQADKEVTIFIQQAAALVDIHIVDHIIIGERDHFSFADAGLL